MLLKITVDTVLFFIFLLQGNYYFPFVSSLVLSIIYFINNLGKSVVTTCSKLSLPPCFSGWGSKTPRINSDKTQLPILDSLC